MDSQRKGTSPLFYTPFDPSSFKRFVFTAQAIGEPEQVYSLEPYDWAEATNHHSRLVQEAN